MQSWWDAKDPAEKQKIKRILANKTLAELIALGLVIAPLWYITRGGTRPPASELPTVQISDFMRKKLSHLPQNKNNIYDVFTILKIKSNASPSEIEKSFKKVSIMVHPDKAILPAKKERQAKEDLGAREISKEEFKLRLARKRDPTLPPVSTLPSPPIVISSEVKALYDKAFKDLQRIRDIAIKYAKHKK